MERRKSVLIIDNERPFTALLREFLGEACGYEVEVVPDGYNGLIMARKIMPGVVLLDIRMPALNGLQVLEKLKADTQTADIPVIIITGFDDEENRKQAMGLKAADYLVKPVSLKVLRERINAVMGA